MVEMEGATVVVAKWKEFRFRRIAACKSRYSRFYHIFVCICQSQSVDDKYFTNLHVSSEGHDGEFVRNFQLETLPRSYDSTKICRAPLHQRQKTTTTSRRSHQIVHIIDLQRRRCIPPHVQPSLESIAPLLLGQNALWSWWRQLCRIDINFRRVFRRGLAAMRKLMAHNKRQCLFVSPGV